MMMLALRRASAVAGLTAAAACVQHRKTSECFFWRKAAEPSPTLSSRDFVLAPYGVLGERLTRDRRLVAMAPEPASERQKEPKVCCAVRGSQVACCSAVPQKLIMLLISVL